MYNMAVSVIGIAVTIIISFLSAELFGYFLHKLMHSNKIRFLSHNHMIHHLKLYGSKMALRTKEYKDSVTDRVSIAGIGLEWMLPVILFLLFFTGVGLFIQFNIVYLIIFELFSLLYGYFLFGYIHDSLHIEGFWMLKNKLLKKHFLHARKLHDIHHIQLDNQGRMNTNYGIFFFFFDRVFGTLQSKSKAINEYGYKAALKRYDYLF